LYWFVKTRDAVTYDYAGMSAIDSFWIWPRVLQAPSIPTFVDELDNECTASCAVTLEWSGSGDRYRVQVDDSPDFSSVNYQSEWLSGTSYDVTLIPDSDTTWYWRVHARKNFTDWFGKNYTFSDWSSIDSFQVKAPPNSPPLPPTLIPEPDFFTTGEDVTITLEWNPVTDPDGNDVEYYVEVDDASDFTSPDFTSGWISTTSFDITVQPCTDWYWHVKARDAVDTGQESGWSDVGYFKDRAYECEDITAPTVPILIPEPDIVSIGPADITLEWHASIPPPSSSVEYRIQLSDSGNFSTDIDQTSPWISGNCVGGICSWTVTLDTGKTWHWRAQARDADNIDKVSPWSTADSFSIFSSNPPPSPILIDEPDILTTLPTAVTLEWNTVNDPDGDPVEYYVEISSSGSFASIQANSSWISGNCIDNKCSWIVALDTYNTWYWRVKARDAIHTDAQSSYSRTDDFDLFSGPPAPTVTAEPDAVSSGPKAVTLQWSAVVSPDGDSVEYYVEVSPSDSFVPIQDNSDWISGTSWTVTLPTAQTWYWRVKARDIVHTDGVSPWSTADSFIIFSSNSPPAPILIDESDNGLVPVDVTLEWNVAIDPDGDPVEYFVQVDDAPDFSSPDYTSDWISGTSWVVTIENCGTWYWRVMARDAVHTDAISSYSDADSFIAYDQPPKPTLIPELDIIGEVTEVTLEWELLISPDGDPVEYYVEIDTNSNPCSFFWCYNYKS
jgi:hypothetical protein